MQTGSPAKLAANVAKLSPGYAGTFSLPRLLFAVAGTLAWLWLVRWRTGRNRHPLWKSLVLPASGVALCWLLTMTLLLPPVDNARSYRSMIQRIARIVPATSGCVAAPDMPRAQVVALEYLGGYRVDAVTPLSQTRCDYLLMARTQVKPGAGWEYLGRERRIRKDDDVTDIYRRTAQR
jgi:4-amino-4-deoxy-L-arabinose transferase-like glycosyltransferase